MTSRRWYHYNIYAHTPMHPIDFRNCCLSDWFDFDIRFAFSLRFCFSFFLFLLSFLYFVILNSLCVFGEQFLITVTSVIFLFYIRIPWIQILLVYIVDICSIDIYLNSAISFCRQIFSIELDTLFHFISSSFFSLSFQIYIFLFI